MRLPCSAALIVAALLLSGGLAVSAPAPEFFAFCMDTHDARQRDLPAQAQMLKELGYDGLGHLWLDRLQERVQTVDAAGLKLFMVTLNVDIAPGKTPYDTRLKELLPLLKGRKVQITVLMNGGKPSDSTLDDRAVEILRELGDLAAPFDVGIVLYPHVECWLEKVEDADRVARKTARPNVNVMFNLCHWLRVSESRDYRSVLKQVMPRLKMVSINGADDRDPQPGWARYIQPLGRGSFDNRALLATLDELGYRGPVGLQCYGLPGDARDHLAESMKAWRMYYPQTKTAP